MKCRAVTSGSVLVDDTVIAVSDSEGASGTESKRAGMAVSRDKGNRQRSRSPLEKVSDGSSSATFYTNSAGRRLKSTPKADRGAPPQLSFEEVTILSERIKKRCRRPWTTARVLAEVNSIFGDFDQENLILHIQSVLLGLQAGLSMSDSAMAGQIASVNSGFGGVGDGRQGSGTILFSADVAKAISDIEVGYVSELQEDDDTNTEH